MQVISYELADLLSVMNFVESIDDIFGESSLMRTDPVLADLAGQMKKRVNHLATDPKKGFRFCDPE